MNDKNSKSIVQAGNPSINTLELKTKNRIWELDFLRGVCILLMVMDHFFYNLSFTFYNAWKAVGNDSLLKLIEFARHYWNSDFRDFFRNIVLWSFFALCGMSTSFSRSNLKRGLKLAGVAIAFSLVTYYLSQFDGFKGLFIRFGVLHMLASCILIWTAVNFIFRDRFKTAAACFVLAVTVLALNNGFESLLKEEVTNNFWAFLHESLAKSLYHYSPGDYFPLIPNLGMFMAGAALGPVLYMKRRSLFPWLDKFGWYRPINFFGRHTLIIVILHQIVIMGTLALISWLFITPGDWVLI